MASYTQVTPEEEVAGLMSASERRRRFIAAEAEKENAIKARAVNALAEDEALAARLQDAENSAASEPVAFNAHSDTLTEEALARLAAEDKSAQDAALARRLSGADDPDAALARRLQAAEVVPTAAAVEVDPALVRQVAGRIERLNVEPSAARTRGRGAGPAAPERRAHAGVRRARGEGRRRRDGRAPAAGRSYSVPRRAAPPGRLDAWRDPDARRETGPVAGRGARRHREHLRRAQQCINQIVAARRLRIGGPLTG